MNRKDSHKGGFTLLEILIATGLFAIAVTGLIALFPMVQRVSREGEEEARATLIAQNILDALPLSVSSGSFTLATGASNGTLRFKAIDPHGTSDHFVAYGASCEPLFQLEKEQSDTPVTASEALDIATLRLTVTPSLPGLVRTEVDVASPASAPASGRSIHRFVRLFPIPANHE